MHLIHKLDGCANMMKSAEQDDEEVNDGHVGFSSIAITPIVKKRKQSSQEVNTYDGGLLKEWYAFARERELLLEEKVEFLRQKVVERTRNLDDLHIELDRLEKGLTYQHCICHLLRDLSMPSSRVFITNNDVSGKVGGSSSLSPNDDGVIDLLSSEVPEVDSSSDDDCSLSPVAVD
jgi:hypothetical protein